jgi:hypothetical protein
MEEEDTQVSNMPLRTRAAMASERHEEFVTLLIDLYIAMSVQHRNMRRFFYGRRVFFDESELCIPREYARWLWWSSWMTGVSALSALLFNLYDLSMLAILVLGTSLNYWRHPDYGYRRYLDIASVQIALWWTAFRSVDATEPHRTVGLVFGVVLCIAFVASVYMRQRDVVLSTILHVFVHFFGNLGSIIAFTGGLPRLSDASVFRFLSNYHV